MRRWCGATAAILPSRTGQRRRPWNGIDLATHVGLPSGVIDTELDTGVVGFVSTRERDEVGALVCATTRDADLCAFHVELGAAC